MTTTPNQGLTLYTGADVFVAADTTPTVPNAILGVIDRLAGPSAGKTGTAIANNQTETVLHTLTIPAGAAAAGSAYQIVDWGSFAWSAGTLTFRLRIGGLAGATVATYAFTPTNASGFWRVVGEIVCLSPGATASWNGAVFVAGTFGSALSTNAVVQSAANQTKDSTASQDLVLTAQWGNASQTLTTTGGYAHKVTGAGN